MPNDHRLIKILFAILIFGAYWTGLQLYKVQAAVSLLYFQATSENQQVKLLWATATEINNAGFFVQRSTSRNSGYIRVNPEIIPAKGDGFTGGTYEYLDTGVSNGSQFWYRLESVDLTQASQYSDPVFVIVGVTTTVTGTTTTTATLTSTVAPSQTVTPPTTTPTPTRAAGQLPPTLTPGPLPGPGLPPLPGTPPVLPSPGAAYPAPGAPGPNPYPPGSAPLLDTPPPVLDLSVQEPTATLIPFPTVTIIFPRVNSPVVPIPEVFDPFSWLLSRQGLLRLWPLGLLIIGWGAIGIWFYLTHRHIN